jgi:hypothetical protein
MGLEPSCGKPQLDWGPLHAEQGQAEPTPIVRYTLVAIPILLVRGIVLAIKRRRAVWAHPEARREPGTCLLKNGRLGRFPQPQSARPWTAAAATLFVVYVVAD